MMAVLVSMIFMIIRRMLMLILVILMISLVVWHCRCPLVLVYTYIIDITLLLFLFIIGKAFLINFTDATLSSTILLHCLTLCIRVLENWRTCAGRHPQLTHLVVFISVLSNH
jgi:hypothetical protein